MNYVNQWQRKWHRNLILETIRGLYSAGTDVSYNALARTNQALVSAANYHFGSYRRACMMAGLDYGAIAKKPKWTPAKVIDLVRQARRSGEALNWRAISGRHDDLRRAAAAAVKKRLFGKWDDALFAAGAAPDEIRRYHKWDAAHVLAELSRRAEQNQPVNSAAIQKEIPGLYSAAVRHFKTYDAALAAARIDPRQVYQRRTWQPKDVLRELKHFEREHGYVSRTSLRRMNPALLRATRHHFSDLLDACEQAGIKRFRRVEPATQGLLFVDVKPLDAQRWPRVQQHPPLELRRGGEGARPRSARRKTDPDHLADTPLLFAFASSAS